VIHRRQRKIRTSDPDTAIAQLGERLWRCHLVHEVEVDIEDGRGALGLGANEVSIPDFVDQGFRSHRASVIMISLIASLNYSYSVKITPCLLKKQRCCPLPGGDAFLTF
jgi:hypothetical protein